MQWGYPRRWLAETGSTNDEARTWAMEGAPEGAVVVAARQMCGRGRRARVWESSSDVGLYVSFILRPGWPAKRSSNLAIIAGMAAFHALKKVGVPGLRVKWPNDLLADGRKICGVLVEPLIGAGHIEFTVLGMGINVGQEANDFSPELRSRVTSCRMEGLTISVDRMLDVLVESLQTVCHTPFDALCAEWLAAGAKEGDPEL